VKQLVVLSGTPGSRIATLTAALAHLASAELSLVLADADVESPVLEVVVRSRPVQQHAYEEGQRAVVDAQLCTACDQCTQVCRFGAIVRAQPSYRINAPVCRGCAACFYQCPVHAIRMEKQRAGEWYLSDSRLGPLFHARLDAGRENSGKLISTVKQQGRLWARNTGAQLLLIVGPPGAGQPALTAAEGADLALLIADPAVTSPQDLRSILEATQQARVPALVVVDKADVNLHQTSEIEALCAEMELDVVGHVPYDLDETTAIVSGQSGMGYADNTVSRELRGSWKSIKARLR